jgi:hypothetical protein
MKNTWSCCAASPGSGTCSLRAAMHTDPAHLQARPWAVVVMAWQQLGRLTAGWALLRTAGDVQHQRPLTT